MKTKPSDTRTSSPFGAQHDRRIDAALHLYARSLPRPGLESRVAARLASAPRMSALELLRSFFSAHSAMMQRLAAGVLGVAAACAIVFGTLQHSHRNLAPLAAAPARSSGISPAGDIHVPTRAVPATSRIDPASPRAAAHGRARISPNQARRAGAAHPRSPYPPDAQPESSPDRQQ